jgi:transcriptional regulator with PAS, ATPase and Fis domain
MALSDASLALLAAYHWPGNVRELENVIERAVVLSEEELVEPRHLPAELCQQSGEDSAPRIPGSPMADIERYAILRTLEAHGGSTSKAADVLGISVRKIQYKLHEYGAAPKSQVPAIRRSSDAAKAEA